MKEIILHEEATVANRAYFNYDSGLTKNNILGVLNKTTGKVIYTPLKFTRMTMFQSLPLEDGTRNYTLQFTNLPPIAVGDQLLIKLYSDAAGGYDEMVAQFFGLPEALPEGYQAMTQQEVTDTLEDIMGNIDIELSETVEYPEGSGQYMTRAQAITAQANEIIHTNS